MPARDGSHERRVSDLEVRLRDLEREVRAARRADAAAPTPRERWLGRTYSDSPGSYPAAGANTFEVQLLSCDFAATPGVQAITEVERGSIVVARTWPAAYLARGTEVEVYRARGMGALGRGEWWINASPPASADNLIFYGGTNYGRDSGFVLRNNFGSLRLFPGVAMKPNGAQGGPWLSEPVPVNNLSPALLVERDGTYLLNYTCVWEVPKLSVEEHEYLHFSLYGHVGQFAPVLTFPNWRTADAAGHSHQYWPYVPYSTDMVATLSVDTTGDQHYTSYSRLPLSADAIPIAVGVGRSVRPGGYRIGQMAGGGVLTMAAGEQITFDLSCQFDFFPYVGLAVESQLVSFFYSLLWIG